MPALRNRLHPSSSRSSANGSIVSEMITQNGSAPSATSYLKKKLSLLEEETDNRDSNNNNNSEDEIFSDTYAVSSKMGDKNDSNDDPIVFSNNNSSLNQSARDQFAVALLRLQANLEATSKRLNEIEAKMSSWQRQQQKAQQKAQAHSGARGLFSAKTMSNVVYLSWPIVVFLAMRAIERRSLSGKLAM